MIDLICFVIERQTVGESSVFYALSWFHTVQRNTCPACKHMQWHTDYARSMSAEFNTRHHILHSNEMMPMDVTRCSFFVVFTHPLTGRQSRDGLWTFIVTWWFLNLWRDSSKVVPWSSNETSSRACHWRTGRLCLAQLSHCLQRRGCLIWFPSISVFGRHPSRKCWWTSCAFYGWKWGANLSCLASGSSKRYRPSGSCNWESRFWGFRALQLAHGDVEICWNMLKSFCIMQPRCIWLQGSWILMPFVSVNSLIMDIFLGHMSDSSLWVRMRHLWPRWKIEELNSKVCAELFAPILDLELCPRTARLLACSPWNSFNVQLANLSESFSGLHLCWCWDFRVASFYGNWLRLKWLKWLKTSLVSRSPQLSELPLSRTPWQLKSLRYVGPGARRGSLVPCLYGLNIWLYKRLNWLNQ